MSENIPVNNKKASNWTDDDIVKWSEGAMSIGSGTNEADLLAEAGKRADNTFQSLEELQAFLTGDRSEETELPEPAPVDDTIDQLLDEEEGETEPTPVEVVKVEEPKVEPKVQEPTASPTASNSIEENLMKEIETYIEEMKPGKSHFGEEGPMRQVKLYRTIQAILRLEGTSFNKMMNYLLSKIKDHRKGVFGEKYIFRYMSQVKLADDQRKNFERFMSLLLTTCDSATRAQALKQVDLELVMKGFKNSEMQQRVEAFYSGV
ncbi:MAG: hypothetical protein IBX57_00310 [Gammaproteobacteria bacterium]|nr:hypothetical protein [Gammaproteobacteria bacterium]